jgi:hypothetical protein
LSAREFSGKVALRQTPLVASTRLGIFFTQVILTHSNTTSNFPTLRLSREDTELGKCLGHLQGARMLVLEEQRYIHEDLERLEQGIADRIRDEPKHVSLLNPNVPSTRANQWLP